MWWLCMHTYACPPPYCRVWVDDVVRGRVSMDGLGWVRMVDPGRRRAVVGRLTGCCWSCGRESLMAGLVMVWHRVIRQLGIHKCRGTAYVCIMYLPLEPFRSPSICMYGMSVCLSVPFFPFYCEEGASFRTGPRKTTTQISHPTSSLGRVECK